MGITATGTPMALSGTRGVQTGHHGLCPPLWAGAASACPKGPWGAQKVAMGRDGFAELPWEIWGAGTPPNLSTGQQLPRAQGHTVSPAPATAVGAAMAGSASPAAVSRASPLHSQTPPAAKSAGHVRKRRWRSRARRVGAGSIAHSGVSRPCGELAPGQPRVLVCAHVCRGGDHLAHGSAGRCRAAVAKGSCRGRAAGAGTIPSHVAKGDWWPRRICWPHSQRCPPSCQEVPRVTKPLCKHV